jgi:heme exporter protein D
MYWHSFSDFVAMGTHGPYVWGSVVVFAIALALEPLIVKRGLKNLIARLKREFATESPERAKLRENIN